ncbi:cytochrome P450 98A3 [Earliella scabrosa]|nr:cytochrome P450 98A3 [Earliella scabrosa]
MTLPQLPASALWSWIGLLSTLFVLVLFISIWLQAVARARRLPPGPTPLPIVGNILQMPRKDLGREFAQLSNVYGPITHLSVLGQSIVVLGSYKDACELMNKRSANYSDRPESVMVPLVGFSWLFILMNYGAEWRQHRRAFHQQMTADVIPQYEPIQLKATRNLLRSVLHSPKDVGTHLRFTFAAITMRIAYGVDLQHANDEHFAMIERMAEVGATIAAPGRFLVEVIPWLRFLPAWLPGAEFKRYAEGAKRDILHIVNYLFETAKELMVSPDDDGRVNDSFVTRLLDGHSPNTREGQKAEEICKGISATAYLGLEQINTAMRAFLVAMAMFPDVQKRAQAELDTAVGRDRLPESSDLESLHYTRAAVKELLRWHVVTPIGVPHRAVSDDEYNGYLIPAGATVLATVWAISRDPETYPDPENFVPERFLDKNGQLDVNDKDPADFIFGFGRRICPGRLLAESSLLMICASLLWAFDIRPPVDEHGISIPVERKISACGLVA